MGAWRWGLGGRTAGFVGSRLGTDCYFVIDLIPGFLPDCIYTIFSRGRDLDLSIYTNIWGGGSDVAENPQCIQANRVHLYSFSIVVDISRRESIVEELFIKMSDVFQECPRCARPSLKKSLEK